MPVSEIHPTSQSAESFPIKQCVFNVVCFLNNRIPILENTESMIVYGCDDFSLHASLKTVLNTNFSSAHSLNLTLMQSSVLINRTQIFIVSFLSRRYVYTCMLMQVIWKRYKYYTYIHMYITFQTLHTVYVWHHGNSEDVQN